MGEIASVMLRLVRFRFLRRGGGGGGGGGIFDLREHLLPHVLMLASGFRRGFWARIAQK